MQATDRARGLAWALVAAFSAASFMVPWKLATQHGEVRTIVLIMLLSAAILNTALAPMMAPASGVRLDRATWILGFVLAVLTLAGNLASAAAVARISGPLLSVLQRAEVIIVALLAWAMIGERVNGSYWLGAAVALTGLVIVHNDGTDTRMQTTGLLLGGASALCFGTMAVLIRRQITRIEPVRVNAIRLWMSVGFWFVLYGAPPPLSELNPQVLLYAGLAALLGPGFSRLAAMFASRHLEARIPVLVGLSTPVFTLLLTWILIGTWPDNRELTGGAVLLAGIAIPLLALLRRD